MIVDTRYARSINSLHVQRLAAHWDRNKIGVTALSQRKDGSMAILDGVHRRHAAEQAEGPTATLPALVYHGLTFEEEATLFRAFNEERWRPLPGDIFRAKVQEGDRAAVHIMEITQSLGLALVLHPSSHRWNEIAAIRAVERSYDLLGIERFARMLTVMRDGWEGHKGAFEVTEIASMTLFFVRYADEFHYDHLIATLKAHPPDDMFAGIAALRTLGAHARDLPTLGGQVILGWYNDHFRQPLPDWKSRKVAQAPKRERAIRHFSPVLTRMFRFFEQERSGTVLEIAKAVGITGSGVEYVLKRYPELFRPAEFLGPHNARVWERTGVEIEAIAS